MKIRLDLYLKYSHTLNNSVIAKQVIECDVILSVFFFSLKR